MKLSIFFHWFYETARLQQMDSFISLCLYTYLDGSHLCGTCVRPKYFKIEKSCFLLCLAFSLGHKRNSLISLWGLDLLGWVLAFPACFCAKQRS